MNFLDNYMLYSSSNAAPSNFHTWGGISALSHLIGPRVWTHMGGKLTFYSNMYILFVGEPGLRKSTAMNQARDLIETQPIIAQAPASTSKEGIVKLMTMKETPSKRTYAINKGEFIPYSQLSIFASEIVSLLNASGNAEGTIEFLTDIWDRTGRTYREFFKTSGDSDIVRPYISILGCLTPSTLQKLVTSKVVTSGMTRRCLFIYAKKNNKGKAFIEVDKEQAEAWTHCVFHAAALQNVVGEFTWEDEARVVYKEWFDKFDASIDQVSSAVLRNFYMSKPEYVIKVSMMLALADVPPRLVHTRYTFERALQLVSSVESGACLLFDSSGQNKLTNVLPEVENWLENRPGEHKEFDLLPDFWKDLVNAKDDIRAIVDQLERLGKIKIRLETDGTGQTRYIKYINASA